MNTNKIIKSISLLIIGIILIMPFTTCLADAGFNSSYSSNDSGYSSDYSSYYFSDGPDGSSGSSFSLMCNSAFTCKLELVLFIILWGIPAFLLTKYLVSRIIQTIKYKNSKKKKTTSNNKSTKKKAVKRNKV
jgi:hypothetical protein